MNTKYYSNTNFQKMVFGAYNINNDIVAAKSTAQILRRERR